MDSEEIQGESEEQEILQFLVDNEFLQSAAHGIALQVLDKGREGLNGRQIQVFENQIEEKYFNLECSRCATPMPTSEIVFALEEEDGLCSWCRKMEDNDD